MVFLFGRAFASAPFDTGTRQVACPDSQQVNVVTYRITSHRFDRRIIASFPCFLEAEYLWLFVTVRPDRELHDVAAGCSPAILGVDAGFNLRFSATLKIVHLRRRLADTGVGFELHLEFF